MTQLDQTIDTRRAPYFRRLWVVLGVLVALLLLVLIPPYVNVNRYQRRITTSISESLGRPVHLDNVTLNLLPVPGLTLDHFVVSEDPAFGSEPTIRANSVHATLRVSSLWRRRVEFSTISLDEPSINLVHTALGTWNVDSILLQAAHLEAAPTSQSKAGSQPRFPYIEATGARINLKFDQVKSPFSLTDSDFSLWLPDPQTWHFRITAHPTRTDLPVGYAGVLHLDGTLGRSSSIEQIPIDLHGEWKSAPLGEVSRILLGRDAGWRGDMTLSGSALGTIGTNELHARVHIEDAHRSDFVPAHPMAMTAECTATTGNSFHAIMTARCAIPNGPNPPYLTATGSLADIRQAGPATLTVEVPPTQVSDLTGLLRTVSQRVPERLVLGGVLSGTMTWQNGKGPALTGSMALKAGTIQASPDDKSPILLGDAVLRPAGEPVATKGRRDAPVGSPATLLLMPTTIALGGREPVTLDGRLDPHGISFHVAGVATPQRLAALTSALPPFGDGLQQVLPTTGETMRLDLTATRPWGGAQTWQAATERPALKRRRKR
jgi:AsmA protein